MAAIFAGGIDVSRLPIPGLDDPLAAGLSSRLRHGRFLTSGQILSDERMQASRSFSSNGLLR